MRSSNGFPQPMLSHIYIEPKIVPELLVEVILLAPVPYLLWLETSWLNGLIKQFVFIFLQLFLKEKSIILAQIRFLQERNRRNRRLWKLEAHVPNELNKQRSVWIWIFVFSGTQQIHFVFPFHELSLEHLKGLDDGLIVFLKQFNFILKGVNLLLGSLIHLEVNISIFLSVDELGLEPDYFLL